MMIPGEVMLYVGCIKWITWFCIVVHPSQEICVVIPVSHENLVNNSSKLCAYVNKIIKELT